jgi:DNA-binding protein HU-beta
VIIQMVGLRRPDRGHPWPLLAEPLTGSPGGVWRPARRRVSAAAHRLWRHSRHRTGEHFVNKTELIDAIAKDSGLSRTDSARSLDSLITTVQKTLKKGDDVAITGFGKFSVTKRAARAGRNPATGEAIKIKASKAPKFTAGQTLKTAVANKKKA